MDDSKKPAPEKDGGQSLNGDMMETYTPEEEKAVLRKIDMVILPFVSLIPNNTCET